MSTRARRLPLVQVDVFAERPLEGNPLAVFTDGAGLSKDEMQALAREMNLSETTFILPRPAEIERERGVRVRIFTVAEELPFAGHPTLGTASVIRAARGGVGEVALDLDVGRVPVRFEDRPGEPAFGEMTQAEPVFGEVHDRAAVAKVLGLAVGDLDPALPIQSVSTGIGFAITPLRSLSVLRALRIDVGRASEFLERSGGLSFYFVTRDTRSPARLRARLFFYGGEDPATGSAAGCTAAWMVAHGVARPDEQVLIEQGAEVSRPSRLLVRASRSGDRITNVRVGGRTVEVMRGEVVI